MPAALLNLLHPSNFFVMAISWPVCLLFSYASRLWQLWFGKQPIVVLEPLTSATICSVGSPSNTESYTRPKKDGDDKNASCQQKKPIAIVTGASSGLGEATARELAARNFHVILACRSADKGHQTIRRILEKCPEASLELEELDLCALASINKFAERVTKSTATSSSPPRPIQLLVNNAGILAASQRWTEDHLDCMMATNYLSGFALTNKILQLQSAGSHIRVVNVSSFTHRAVRRLSTATHSLAAGGLANLHSGSRYRMAEVYSATKLCMILFTSELQRKALEGAFPCSLSCIAVDPGLVHTNILREVPMPLQRLVVLLGTALGLMQSPDAAATAVVAAALAALGPGVTYVMGREATPVPSSTPACDAELAATLWQSSEALVGSRGSK